MMSKIFVYFFALIVIISGMSSLQSCKSTKTTKKNNKTEMEDDKEAKAKRMLKPIIMETTKLPVKEQVEIVKQVKAMNLTDPEVVTMIKEAEELLRRKIPKKDPMKKKAKRSSLSLKLEYNFERIATVNNYNKSKQLITSTLKLFNSKSTPVLVIVSNNAGVVDYDKPTTIEHYLNYLKDVNESPNKVHKVITDGDKKISELILISKKNN